MRHDADTAAREHPVGCTEPPPPVADQRAALEGERLRIQAEIVSYPMPIPACDVYFNGLLEQRARVCEALARLDRQDRHSDV
jgi:hypothetical protein